jgi:hypothetical protein
MSLDIFCRQLLINKNNKRTWVCNLNVTKLRLVRNRKVEDIFSSAFFVIKKQHKKTDLYLPEKMFEINITYATLYKKP